MTKTLTLSALALGLATMTAPTADALGVIWSETHDYGTGQYDPGGSDTLGSDYVTVSDASSTRFSDAFDFGALSFASIDRFDLTLTFSGAGPSGFGFIEAWKARMPGTDSSFTSETGGDNSGSANDYFKLLSDDLSPQTITLSVLSDSLTGSDAFSEAVRIEKFIFGFSEVSPFTSPDAFDLDSAKLDIVGVVPLPGAVWMLGGMTGLGLWASRRKSRT